jgi:hypothetical protein
MPGHAEHKTAIYVSFLILIYSRFIFILYPHVIPYFHPLGYNRDCACWPAWYRLEAVSLPTKDDSYLA